MKEEEGKDDIDSDPTRKLAKTGMAEHLHKILKVW